MVNPVEKVTGGLALTGFEISPASGWRAQTIETRANGDDQPGAPAWSLAVASQEEGKRERLGIFVALDVGELLAKREWQLTLEQEMANVRQRARQFLADRRKAGSKPPGSA